MKKILPVAVLAALAGVNAAQAVHVNSDGLGQVLLYPYYSTEGDNDTYIALANTTSEYKAVKIRILESMNSNEVLDFNLYMSPYDHWSAVITSAADEASIDVEGATLRSADTSCTVPLAVSQGDTIAFREYVYDGDSESGLDRTQEGYVEIIEMGVITDPVLQAAIKHGSHSDGEGGTEWRPANCAFLDAQWRDGGEWLPPSGDADYGMSGVTGGLYGYGVLINVEDGTSAGYDATAIDAFADDFQLPGALHQEPGNVQPSLADATDEITIFNEGDAVNYTLDDGLDAVSAILMATSISNDYVADEGRNAKTDWILTMPTKRQYVNVEDPDEDPAEPPFTDVWDGKTACEEVSIEFWDREEAFEDVPSDVGFSPRPPQVEIPATSLCTEVSVLGFGSESAVKAGAAIYSGIGDSISGAGFSEGWARVGFDTEGHELQAESGDIFLGLPVIGFAVQTVRNENANPAADSVIANYAASVEHKSVLEVDPD